MNGRKGAAVLAGMRPVDTTVLSLVAANLVAIVLALAGGWSLATVIFIYWAQSVIIGVFTVARILSLDIGGVAVPTTATSGPAAVPAWFARYGTWALAGFFALHYGLFHFGYLEFIDIFAFSAGEAPWTQPGVLLACGVFFANHLYSFLYYRVQRPNVPVTADTVKEIFVAPYARIIPMHITIIVGGFASLVLGAVGFDATPFILVLFLGLKTYVDVRMHVGKHGGWTDFTGGEAAGSRV
ncbi:hypothetical protein AZH53_09955 [Methanomicrobiaceae archaeon CYW5]|uniref:DUF6498-containing protein n=1 Tax=Methanovulcanius yangii TaxID=1789227 RepID=UPI0029CA8E52|nr:DUF6498-containing protein [Methanovulcanius yangii]MBT8508728.1 hypothetical protein [Methanovulcanius yangii]